MTLITRLHQSTHLFLAAGAAIVLGLTAAGCTARAETPFTSTSYAPDVPTPIDRRSPAVVHVDFDASIARIGLAQGVLYDAWTFNGHVPGPFIRARVGDTLEVSITNSDTMGMAHNLDLHAITGPGGGGPLTSVAPGEHKTARFKLEHVGLFVYHCGTPPVMDHIANGMYGLLLVEPEGGLPKVDHEYYVMQSEFYATPPDPKTMVAAYSHEAGLREDPTYVVYNGDGMALMGDAALRAKTNQTVRIYFGNAGPNKVASLHFVGLVMDTVYREGDLSSPPAKSVQTTMVPPGGAAVVDLKTEVPGVYAMMDHAIFRMEKGAMGQLRISGPERTDVYTQY